MKYLEFLPPDYDDEDQPQKVLLREAPGSTLLGTIRGCTAPNPQIPGNPDRPNMSEYPIVHPGTYIGTFHEAGHHGRPAIHLRDDGEVPILQDENPRTGAEGTAVGIRVHEQYSGSWRGSAGCMTLESPGGDEFLLKHFTEGEQVAMFIPDQDWFANA